LWFPAQELLRWNNGNISPFKMKLQGARCPTCTRIYFFPQQEGEVLKGLLQNTAGAKSLELRRV